MPSNWLEETKVRISAFRELSEAGTPKAVEQLQKAWRDKFGRIPSPAENLIKIAQIKAIAAAEGINSVEVQAQRLMLHRNGDYILMEGRRFPRLQSASPQGKLTEATTLLLNF